MNKRILKSSDNKIWTYGNKIVTDVPFEQTTLAQGKIAEYVSGDYNNIGGFAQSWNDSVGTNHLIQATEVNRPAITIVNNIPCILPNNSKHLYFTNNISVSTLFLVFYHKAGVTESSFYNNFYLYGGAASAVFNISDASVIYLNAVQYSLNTAKTTGKIYVMAAAYAAPKLFTAFTTKMFTHQSFLTRTFNKEILHLTPYNRILSHKEILFNTNALIKKYNIVQ